MISSNSGRASPGRQGASARLDLWIEQILADKRLPRNAVRVALALRKFLNSKTLKAWPAVKTLADLAGVTERTVQRLIRAMKAAGHLLIEDWAGPRGCNVFTASLLPETEAAMAPADRPAEPAPTFAGDRAKAQPRPALPVNFDRDRVRVQREDARWPFIERAWRAATGKALPQDHRFGWFVPRRIVEAALGAGG